MAVTSGATREPATSAGPTLGGSVAAAAWDGLGAAAARFGVALTREQLARFECYRLLLLDRNARTNLTAITDRAEVERRLFLDALLMLPAIDAATGGGAARLVDVGTGAGFPGLALKIARPVLDVALVEATGKKAAFLAEAIGELGLTGAVVVHGRAEEIGRDAGHRGRYDVATARAVGALPVLLELCAPLLGVGGRALFPKGMEIAAELGVGRRAAAVLGVRIVGSELLPGGGTRLVVVEKVGPTPLRYPRRAGMPAREPLGTGAGRSRGTAGGGRDAR